MKQRILGIIILIILIQMTAVFAAPVVNSFTTKFVYPDHIQLEWSISSAAGLRDLEIFKDKEPIYYTQITGTQHTGMYQTPNDNRTHIFSIVVYDITNSSAEKSEKSVNDNEAPKIISSSKVISNQNQFVFVTNEPSYCIAGFRQKNMTPISKLYEIEHTVKLSFVQGSNTVLIQCVDKRENEMESFVSMMFVLDTTKPGKVSNIAFSKEGSSNKLTWDAAADANGIQSYNIYNIIEKITNVNTNSWIVTTNDSVFYISAVDKAGNEGEKEQYDYKRALLLSSDFKPEPAKKEINETKTVVEWKSLIPDIKVGKSIWIAIAAIIVIFIAWKIYEYKTDRHGLRRYLRQRKKMRDRL